MCVICGISVHYTPHNAVNQQFLVYNTLIISFGNRFLWYFEEGRKEAEMTIVGSNIRSIRQARGLTQAQLGELIGKNQRTLSSWERGSRSPSPDEVRLLAQVLRVAPAEIIGHNDIADHEFEYIVTSDDMSPEIVSGDTLTVNSRIHPHDGDLVVVEVEKKNHASQIVRRLYKYGQMLSLLAVNPSIKPLNIDADQVTIKGKVTELRRTI
jgi:SOS-response transcriptional repressor LexA